MITKIGKRNNDLPNWLILAKISLVKFVPITHPSKALTNGSGFLGSFISTLSAQKRPIINKGPSIHGRGIPILCATKPPNTAKNILSKYFKSFFQYKINVFKNKLDPSLKF